MIAAGEGEINQAVRDSVVVCGMNDLECGLYAQFERAAEPFMVDGNPVFSGEVWNESGGLTEVQWQEGNDGWRLTVFQRYDRYVAVSRKVQVNGEDCVVQAMKKGPVSRRGHAAYTFKLFDSNGHEVARLAQGLSNESHLLFVNTTADRAVLSGMAVNMQDALGKALNHPIVIERCYWGRNALDDGYPRIFQFCDSVPDNP